MAIKYGISNFAVGGFTITPEGEGRTGAPVRVPGIVELALDPETVSETFSLGGVPYWSGEVFDGHTGELTGAKFIEPLAETVLIKGRGKQRSYFAFESSGDEPERLIFYNVAFAFAEVERNTTENQTTPDLENIALIIAGDSDTGITSARFKEGDKYYAQIFTDPPDPIDLVLTYLQDENYIDILDENDEEILVRGMF